MITIHTLSITFMFPYYYQRNNQIFQGFPNHPIIFNSTYFESKNQKQFLNSVIYKVYSPLDPDGLSYIGSTSQSIRERFNRHVYFNSPESTQQSGISSKEVFQRYGVDNVVISILEYYPCLNKTELVAREAHHIHTSRFIANKLKYYKSYPPYSIELIERQKRSNFYYFQSYKNYKIQTDPQYLQTIQDAFLENVRDNNRFLSEQQEAWRIKGFHLPILTLPENILDLHYYFFESTRSYFLLREPPIISYPTSLPDIPSLDPNNFDTTIFDTSLLSTTIYSMYSPLNPNEKYIGATHLPLSSLNPEHSSIFDRCPQQSCVINVLDIFPCIHPLEQQIALAKYQQKHSCINRTQYQHLWVKENSEQDTAFQKSRAQNLKLLPLAIFDQIRKCRDQRQVMLTVLKYFELIKRIDDTYKDNANFLDSQRELWQYKGFTIPHPNMRQFIVLFNQKSPLFFHIKETLLENMPVFSPILNVFLCKRCTTFFPSKKFLVQHLSKRTPCDPIYPDVNNEEQLREITSTPTLCPKCGKAFLKMNGFQTHFDGCSGNMDPHFLRVFNTASSIREKIMALMVQLDETHPSEPAYDSIQRTIDEQSRAILTLSVLQNPILFS